MTRSLRPRRRCGGVTLRVALVLAATIAPGSAAWAQAQTQTASDEAGDFFGMPIAISGDTLVVGAARDDVGVANQSSVRVFVRNGGDWIVRQTLTASDATTRDGFGGAVAIIGNTIVVGAVGHNGGRGAVYVFVE